MTKEELWHIIKVRNPGIDGQVTLRAGQVKKLFDLVWEKGYEAGGDHASELIGGTDFFRDVFRGKL